MKEDIEIQIRSESEFQNDFMSKMIEKENIDIEKPFIVLIGTKLGLANAKNLISGFIDKRKKRKKSRSVEEVAQKDEAHLCSLFDEDEDDENNNDDDVDSDDDDFDNLFKFV